MEDVSGEGMRKAGMRDDGMACIARVVNGVAGYTAETNERYTKARCGPGQGARVEHIYVA